MTSEIQGARNYLIVYMPCDPSADVQVDAVAWYRETYDEAVKSVKEFIWQSGDFIPEVDCRFEIFNSELKPVGNQESFQDMILAYFEMRDGKEEEGIDHVGNLPGDPHHPKFEEKEVKFEGIQIEDAR